jgi:GNAT superfamily N-acetyltransferase
MATLTHPARVLMRAAAPGDGRAIASLWRELWEAHEEWGGYPGSRDPGVYAQLAQRLDDDARVRAGNPVLGRHVHLVADIGGVPCGQVEGWVDRYGTYPRTPWTCEVRSLVVDAGARRLGVGRALLDGLASAARSFSRDTACVLAAEVLERNPAHTFYTRVGYAPVAWNARIEADAGAAIQTGAFGSRLAGRRDAAAVTRLEALHAARRIAYGDMRFDCPTAIEATVLGSIGADPGGEATARAHEPEMLVALDGNGCVRAKASLAVHSLEPPFVSMRRAVIGRFAFDGTCPSVLVVAPLVALGCKMARSRGALHVEVTDLPPPGTELHQAALATGARAWSRLLARVA